MGEIEKLKFSSHHTSIVITCHCLFLKKITTKILILTAICLFDDFATTSLLSISALTNLSLSLSRSLSGFSRTELDLRPDDFCLSVLS